jgi:hypothetical protein
MTREAFVAWVEHQPSGELYLGRRLAAVTLTRVCRRGLGLLTPTCVPLRCGLRISDGERQDDDTDLWADSLAEYLG